jgi:hypothetical protein
MDPRGPVRVGWRGPGPDRGQVVPLLAMVLLVTVAGVFLVGQVAAVAADRARARTAADAAALAGAAAGRRQAVAIAEANGARLVAWVEVGDEVEVSVEIGRGQARARARREMG